jgi:predicted nucleic acid-binding protein
MVLVDTSVWVHHLRQGEPNLERLLKDGEVMCHPFVIGELACGSIRNRTEILSLLQILPLAMGATHEEVLQFIERNHLMGKGLGFIDVHLCASAILTGVAMWTYDRRLDETNERLGIGYRPA